MFLGGFGIVLLVANYEWILGLIVGSVSWVLTGIGGLFAYAYANISSSDYLPVLLVVGVIIWYLEHYARRVASRAAKYVYDDVSPRLRTLESENKKLSNQLQELRRSVDT